MCQNFLRAFNFILCLDGGFSNNMSERGKAENFGVTQGAYNAYRKSVNKDMQDVNLIAKIEAEEIYYKEYWLKSGADKIHSPAVSLILFDSCINHGVKVGKELYNIAGNDIDKFLLLRRQKYQSIVDDNPYKYIFIKGWINRLKKIEKFVKTLN